MVIAEGSWTGGTFDRGVGWTEKNPACIPAVRLATFSERKHVCARIELIWNMSEEISSEGRSSSPQA